MGVRISVFRLRIESFSFPQEGAAGQRMWTTMNRYSKSTINYLYLQNFGICDNIRLGIQVMPLPSTPTITCTNQFQNKVILRDKDSVSFAPGDRVRNCK